MYAQQQGAFLVSVRVSIRVTLWLTVYRQSVHLGFKPAETHEQYSFFQLNTCGYSPYVTSSVMRGWVCHLQWLLALTSAVILRPQSHGTHNHILQSQIRDSPNLEGQVPIFISLRNRHWVPLLSPPMTRRATVEVFEPASTRGFWYLLWCGCVLLVDRLVNCAADLNIHRKRWCKKCVSFPLD
jgi:hypothetical protein